MAETFAQRKDYAQAINHICAARSTYNRPGNRDFRRFSATTFKNNLAEFFAASCVGKWRGRAAANARESVDLAAGFVVE